MFFISLFLILYPAYAADTLTVEEQDSVVFEQRDTQFINEFAIAVQLFEDGDYSLAMDHFRSIIESHPQTSQGIESRFYLGMVYRHMGQPENARMTLQTFALTFPDHKRAPDAWWNIADIYAEQNRFTDAGLALERLFQFHPDHKIVPSALLQASTYFEKAGDRKKSDEFLRRIILQHSTSEVISDARLRFGFYRLEDSAYSKAANVFQRVTPEIPEQATDNRSRTMRAQAIFGLARSYHLRRIFDRAEQEYNRVIHQYENTPSHPDALLHLALLHQQQGKHLEAVDLFRRTQRATGGSDDDVKKYIARRAMFGIAESYNALGDYSSAATFFDLYARQHAQTATKEELITIWKGAARANEGMRNYYRAVEWWDRIIQIDAPAQIQEEAYIRSAMNYHQVGQYNNATERLRTYADTFQTSHVAEALYRLGKLYEKHHNDHRRALAAYEELAYRFPESRFIDDAILNQARMQLEIENDRTAHHILREFPQRFPGSSLIEKATALREEIEVYHLQDRDGGFQSITMLMSEMIAGAPRGELAFQLGNIYLDKLKQYPEAARQFEIALSMELSGDKKSRAEYLYAYSLYRMARKSTDRRPEVLDKLYELSTAANRERSPNRETISYYHLEVLRSVAGRMEYIDAAKKYIETFPRADHTIAVRMALAGALEENEEKTRAVEIYREIIRQSQNQPVAGDAMVQLANNYLTVDEDSTALELFTAYIRRHTNGIHIADVILTAADLHRKNGRYREAIDLYRQFVRTYTYHNKIDNVRENLAFVLFEDSRYNESLEIFEDIVAQYQSSYYDPAVVPENILYVAATAAYRAGNMDQSIEYFERYIIRDRSSEYSGIASIILGELYNRRGETQISGFYFGRADEILAGGTANKDIADLLYDNGRYEKAVPHLNAVATNVDSEELRKTYRMREIIAMLRSGRIEDSRRRIEAFKSDFPQGKNALIEFDFEIAMRQFRNRSYDNAAQAFQQFIQQHQEHNRIAYAHFYLGRTWEAVGRRSDAKRKYGEVFEKFPDSGIIPDVHLAYAGLLMREEQFIEAIDHYRIIVETAYDDDDLMYYTMQNLSQAYEEIGFNEAALELIDEFIERFPNDPKVVDMNIKIGTLYQRARLYERAIDKFQSLILYADRALETELRYYAGDSYHAMGNHQRAIHEFLTVAEIDPRTTQLDWTATALYMAGQSYEQKGNPLQAIAMYQEIIDRRGIEAQYKAAARREIERVRNMMNQTN